MSKSNFTTNVSHGDGLTTLIGMRGINQSKSIHAILRRREIEEANKARLTTGHKPFNFFFTRPPFAPV
jgi:hypothetical protein